MTFKGGMSPRQKLIWAEFQKRPLYSNESRTFGYLTGNGINGFLRRMKEYGRVEFVNLPSHKGIIWFNKETLGQAEDEVIKLLCDSKDQEMIVNYQKIFDRIKNRV